MSEQPLQVSLTRQEIADIRKATAIATGNLCSTEDEYDRMVNLYSRFKAIQTQCALGAPYNLSPQQPDAQLAPDGVNIAELLEDREDLDLTINALIDALDEIDELQETNDTLRDQRNTLLRALDRGRTWVMVPWPGRELPFVRIAPGPREISVVTISGRPMTTALALRSKSNDANL